MRFLERLFKRQPESPAEKVALENLDEATREASWGEFEKEAEREAGDPLEPLARQARSPATGGDPDPPDDRSMRDVLHEHEDEGGRS